MEANHMIREKNGLYHTQESGVDKHAIIRFAARLLEPPFMTKLEKPDDVKEYLRLRIGGLPNEIFGVIWLDARHRVLKIEELFYGSVDGASVYPREVVRLALERNAAGVIFFHNHPSGDPSPSRQDKRLTDRLRAALDLIEVRCIDHMVVGREGIVSFSEQGRI